MPNDPDIKARLEESAERARAFINRDAYRQLQAEARERKIQDQIAKMRQSRRRKSPIQRFKDSV